MTRRTLLQRAAGLGIAASTLGSLDVLASIPARAAAAGKAGLPEIQFQIEKFIAPAIRVERVAVRFAPVYTTFATFTLTRTPTPADQATLARALASVEASYPFSPSGVFLTLAYGVPYFERLPGGMAGTLVSAHMPRLSAEPQSYALEEAVPGPTDVCPQNPEVTKLRFNVPVQIESNDMLVTLRSDSTEVIDDVLAWLSGESSTLAGQDVGESGVGELLSVTSRRLMFTQIGLPRVLAEEQKLPYAENINPKSPMWMGFSSQQVNTSGPPSITTFLGDRSAKLTTAHKGDYFDRGSIVHLSHVIQDLQQFYETPTETYVRREAEMFSADPLPRPGNANQFANGGGPAFIPDDFSNPAQAQREAEGATTFDGQPHIGHSPALQRTSRAPNRTPMHIRADGPGFDSLDVPDGSQQPKLHFSIFVPTAAFFATLRRSQASLDLAQQYNVPAANLGLERFLTATRRQNFLVPPRRNRAFPLAELA
ncbi:MAG TPA: hypothetical protein VMF09_17060 [Solirubrobacteraceae bacterium]|nr:hypothetical protein [Solirubrobacteraceae bacterium]